MGKIEKGKEMGTALEMLFVAYVLVASYLLLTDE
jgi:hypothetical protein